MVEYMSSPLISINGLFKKYGERVAVQDVSFSIEEGEIFGLLGPNGAGKTTTLSILSTLLIPDEGIVTISGYDIVREARQVKRLIGSVPQELALYPTLSAWDNLAFFGRIYGLQGLELKGRVTTVLALVGLSDRSADPVQTFSGGMKRRLNIAAGLIHRPRVLFLDEPTVGVDPQSRNFIFEHVKRLNAEGMTIVYTTHYMEEAERLCDRVAIIDHGRILALDTTKGLIDMLGGGVIYLGLPQVALESLLPAVRALSHVSMVTQEDCRLKIETSNARLALLELIELCNAHNVSILSLQMLEPNLESVFLHLTGKRLRD
ncbi:MAG: ATP-binding cassette domain-containing protein [Thermodesulfobacteriota bacterium]|jgi:ABC-2 type transport system ATP-binding protein